MYAFQAIQTALSALAKTNGWPLEPGIYDGDKTTYVTYNEADNRAAEFGDSDALERVVSLQIHYFMPMYKTNTLKKQSYMNALNSIRDALFVGGFSYPEVTIRAETDADPAANVWHIIFECEYTETV